MIRIARHMNVNIWNANDKGIRGKLTPADHER
jgi:hypothetical protein